MDIWSPYEDLTDIFLIKLAHWSLIKVSSSWDETKGKIDTFYVR